jgi:hypothetical protein
MFPLVLRINFFEVQIDTCLAFLPFLDLPPSPDGNLVGWRLFAHLRLYLGVENLDFVEFSLRQDGLLV